MLITITRLKSNPLYTEGELLINDHRYTYTVEATKVMLPTGVYRLDLVKKNARCRELKILANSSSHDSTTPKRHASPTKGWKIGRCNSWMECRKKKTIGIGQPLISGILYKASFAYDRIIKRLEKCKKRKEKITLVIDEYQCVPSKPHPHFANLL